MEETYGKYQFRPKILVLLLAVLILCIVGPILIMTQVQWPSSFSSGTINAITYGTVVIGLGFWMILYRNTRPKSDDYFRRRNFIGLGLLLITGLFLIIFFFANYYLIQNVDVVDLSWSEYFIDRIHTEYNLTLMQMWTDWGRFLGTARYQIILALIYSGVALRFSPKTKEGSYNNLPKKTSFLMILTLGWISVVELFLIAGIGFIWPPVAGRLYFLTGFYPQHFNIVFIPVVLFMFIGNVVYLRGRQYFWSDNAEKSITTTSKCFMIVALVIFNVWFIMADLQWKYFFTDESVIFMIFLFLNALLSGGIILFIQSKNAIMGGKPEKNVQFLSRLSWITFILGIVIFLLGYILQEIGMSFRPSEFLAYYPNLLFGLILTATTYYGGLLLQQKIDARRQIHVDQK